MLGCPPRAAPRRAAWPWVEVYSWPWSLLTTHLSAAVHPGMVQNGFTLNNSSPAAAEAAAGSNRRGRRPPSSPPPPPSSPHPAPSPLRPPSLAALSLAAIPAEQKHRVPCTARPRPPDPQLRALLLFVPRGAPPSPPQPPIPALSVEELQNGGGAGEAPSRPVLPYFCGIRHSRCGPTKASERVSLRGINLQIPNVPPSRLGLVFLRRRPALHGELSCSPEPPAQTLPSAR